MTPTKRKTSLPIQSTPRQIGDYFYPHHYFRWNKFHFKNNFKWFLYLLGLPRLDAKLCLRMLRDVPGVRPAGQHHHHPRPAPVQEGNVSYTWRQMMDDQILMSKLWQVRNTTAIFIINLSVSDLLFCCFNLPLAASKFLTRHWIWGPELCQLYPLLRYGLLGVSVFNILAITINRYVMIAHPYIYNRSAQPPKHRREY